MSIGSVIGKYAIKAAGVAGAGLLAYDAHKRGVGQAEIQKNKKKFEALDYYWDNSRNMPSASHVNAKLKDKLFDLELRNNLRNFVNKGIGYVSGFCNMVAEDIVPWGLSAAAIFLKGSKKVPAPTALDPSAVKTVMTNRSKVAAIGLGAYALYAFAKNVCGFGVSDKKPY